MGNRKKADQRAIFEVVQNLMFSLHIAEERERAGRRGKGMGKRDGGEHKIRKGGGKGRKYV